METTGSGWLERSLPTAEIDSHYRFRLPDEWLVSEVATLHHDRLKNHLNPTNSEPMES
ncbi:MAG: hypothetical protein HQL75_09335 [Magnetococcales bacterium]|nr:hypothetical protein [Magnetococcales bacterium]